MTPTRLSISALIDRTFCMWGNYTLREVRPYIAELKQRLGAEKTRQAIAHMRQYKTARAQWLIVFPGVGTHAHYREMQRHIDAVTAMVQVERWETIRVGAELLKGNAI